MALGAGIARFRSVSFQRRGVTQVQQNPRRRFRQRTDSHRDVPVVRCARPWRTRAGAGGPLDGAEPISVFLQKSHSSLVTKTGHFHLL